MGSHLIRIVASDQLKLLIIDRIRDHVLPSSRKTLSTSTSVDANYGIFHYSHVEIQ